MSLLDSRVTFTIISAMLAIWLFKPKKMRDGIVLLLATLAGAIVADLLFGAVFPRAAEGATQDPIPQTQDVLLSEIAWGGTHASYADEWFELYNNTDHDIPLIDMYGGGGWFLRIYAASGISRTITIPPVNLGPGEYALFERTDEDTIPNVQAKATFTGNIPNDNIEGSPITRAVLVGNGILQHEVQLPNGGWPSGSNTSKASAQLFINGGPSAWSTTNHAMQGARDAEGTLIFGTPGQPNYQMVWVRHNHLPFAGALTEN